MIQDVLALVIHIVLLTTFYNSLIIGYHFGCYGHFCLHDDTQDVKLLYQSIICVVVVFLQNIECLKLNY
jgi:hypothetical protein